MKARLAILATVLVVLLGVLVGAGPSPADVDHGSDGPIFTVMNTSETLPDGVYFRNSPNWDDTSRTYGLGVFRDEQVQLECYVFGQPVGPYNDQLWYYVLNVTRPTNNGLPDVGMLNAHFIDDGLAANVVDAGVPACVDNLPPTPPAALAPAATLVQGPATPSGYRYAVNLSGFTANSSVVVTCYDSVNPGGFHTFTLPTNSSGAASTASYCYSADGPDHWVRANGVESNHVTWSGPAGDPGGSTGGGSGGASPSSPPSTATTVPSDERPSGDIPTPPIPDMTTRNQYPRQPSASWTTRAADAELVAEIQALLGFCYRVYFTQCYANGQHYLQASGAEQYLSMDDLLGPRGLPSLREQYEYWLRDNASRSLSALEQSPVSAAETAPFDTAGTTQNWSAFDASATGTTDWHYALGRFSIRIRGNVWIGSADDSGTRPVQVQYRLFMFDVYNFNPGEEFGSFEKLAWDGVAADFLTTGASQTITTSYTTADIDPGSLVLKW